MSEHEKEALIAQFWKCFHHIWQSCKEARYIKADWQETQAIAQAVAARLAERDKRIAELMGRTITAEQRCKALEAKLEVIHGRACLAECKSCEPVWSDIAKITAIEQAKGKLS